MSIGCALITKMFENAPLVSATRLILVALFNIQNLLTLPLLMPMLRSINYLIKIALAQDTYIVDYVVLVKMCQNELFFYISPNTTFWHNNFQVFEDIVANRSEIVSLEWITDLNLSKKVLAFQNFD